MIGEYFPEYIREKHHNPNFLGRFLREKSAAEKGSLSRVEGYYYDNENKVAVPTARDLIDRIDWSLIFDDIPTRPGHGESLCAFLRWLGVAVHTYFEDPNGKYAIVASEALRFA